MREVRDPKALGEPFFCFHEPFLARANEAPRKPALIDCHDSWTYAELKQASEGLAALLRRSGVQQDDVVLVVAERCATFVVAILGILCAGARFMVIEHDQLGRLDQVLLKAKPSYCLLATPRAALEAEFSSSYIGSADVLELSQRKQQLLRQLSRSPSAAEKRQPDVRGLQIRAYVLWTSGSSSQPKLVSTLHGSILNFMKWYAGEFGLNSADSFALLSGLGHDPMVRDIFVPLSLGGCVRIPSAETRVDGDALYSWLLRSGVSVIHLTPPLLDVLATGALERTLESVRLVAFGGDRLTVEHARRACAVFPRAQLVNFYGATETPQAMSFYRIPLSGLGHDVRNRVPVGRGITGAELIVLREDGRPCDQGEHGEVFIRSQYLSEGYLGMSDENQRRFLTPSDARTDDDRMFRTGDVGFVDAAGDVTLIGRRDRQVKVRGHRIDLADVEVELESHVSVKRAAVVFDEARELLTAFVAPRDSMKLSELELRSHLATRLRAHECPTHIVEVRSLELTPNGKVDYSRLGVAPTARVTATESLASTNVSKLLMTICSSELPGIQLDGSKSFYELGVDSLRAVRIADRVSSALGRRISGKDLFIYPTLASLETFLTSSESAPRMNRATDSNVMEGRQAAILRAKERRSRVNG